MAVKLTSQTANIQVMQSKLRNGSGRYEGRPCRAKMIGLTAWRQKRSTFTHWRLRGRGGLCLTDLAVHFAPDWSKKYFSLGCCLPAPEIEGGADRREQKSTFTGRRIRGQRRRANGRAVECGCRNSSPLLLQLCFAWSSLPDPTTNSRPATHSPACLADTQFTELKPIT